jgi:hypothetical protein
MVGLPDLAGWFAAAPGPWHGEHHRNPTPDAECANSRDALRSIRDKHDVIVGYVLSSKGDCELVPY